MVPLEYCNIVIGSCSSSKINHVVLTGKSIAVSQHFFFLLTNIELCDMICVIVIHTLPVFQVHNLLTQIPASFFHHCLRLSVFICEYTFSSSEWGYGGKNRFSLCKMYC